jgi:hypothetical protein
VKKAIELIGVVLSSAIFSLIVTFVVSGINSSGLIGVELTHAYFWLAFGLAVATAPTAAYLIWKSFKFATICLVATVVVMGGGLWHLDSWLTLKKAQQDAANQPPSPLHTSAPPPSVPIIKTLVPHNPIPVKPQQDNSVHVEHGGKIEMQSSGDCSPNIVGGSNSVNCGPPPLVMQWAVRDIDPPNLPEDKHTFKYEKQITVSVNQVYTPISVGVVCSDEIGEIDGHVMGKETHFAPMFGTDRDNKKVGFVYWEGTPAGPDRPLFILVWSDTPLSILAVRQAKINRN